MRSVISRQHLETDVLVLHVDGSEVTTNDDDNAGLDYGEHLAFIKKGAGADSNLVTITLKNPLGLPMKYFVQPITLDCLVREESAPTKDTLILRVLELDGVTQEDDADFLVFIFGTRQVRQGNYG
jgi:hypothetical protein